MKITTHKTLSLALLFIFLSSCSSFKKKVYSEDEIRNETAKINIFFEENFQNRINRSPQSETYVGATKLNQHKLNDYTDENYEKEHEILLSEYEKLKTFNYDALDDQAKISYRLFEHNTNQAKYNFKFRFHYYPVNQMFGIQSSLPSFMINMHRIESEKDARDYILRLKEFKRVFSEVIKSLKTREKLEIIVPKFAIPKSIRDSRNIISGIPFEKSSKLSPLFEDFTSKLRKLKGLKKSQRETLLSEAKSVLKESVEPSYNSLISYLKYLHDKAPDEGGAHLLPDGDDFYESVLKHHTSTDLTANEIHNIGLSEVKRIQEEMRLIMKKVSFKGNLQDFFKYIQTSPKFKFPDSNSGKKQYVQSARRILNHMKTRLDEMFGIKPQADFVIKPVEKYREKSAGLAFYQGPSADGKRAGKYYINLYDMNAVLKYEMEALAYHEAIPGHHMQRAISLELKDIPKFRKYGGTTAFSEGWGLYSEYLPKEYGFYQDPYSDFGRLSMELRRATRLVVDTGIHFKKWSKAQAVSYLNENTPSFEADNIKAAERYIVMPGQATAYKIGMLKILELRKRAKEKLGEKFRIQSFHDEVLKHGSIPLSLLEQRIDLWIKKST